MSLLVLKVTFGVRAWWENTQETKGYILPPPCCDPAQNCGLAQLLLMSKVIPLNGTVIPECYG